MQGGLACRVPGADDKDVTALHRPCLAAGHAVEDAGADEIFEARDAQSAPGDAGCDDHRSGCDLAATGELHDAPVTAALQADHRLREHHVSAEHPGLLAGPAGELMTADAIGESRVI